MPTTSSAGRASAPVPAAPAVTCASVDPGLVASARADPGGPVRPYDLIHRFTLHLE